MHGLLPFAAGVACASLLGACATPKIESTLSDVSERVPFLRPGETSLREAFDRLGYPARRHFADGVYVWNAGVDQDDRLRIIDAGAKPFVVPYPWSNVRYELVLEFDADGTYVRGTFVHAE
jgi:hypothetical protein